MTERERWIVYPLLFLALGAALRDKLSEHTKTKSIECQELTVYGEDGAGQQPVPLVQIGAVKRTSAESPHLGQILVNGVVQAQAIRTDGVRAGLIQADAIQTSNINAGNYNFRSVPFAPQPVRAVPGISTGHWLQSQQQQTAGTSEVDADAEGEAAGDVQSAGAPAKASPTATQPETAAEPSQPVE